MPTDLAFWFGIVTGCGVGVALVLSALVAAIGFTVRIGPAEATESTEMAE